VHIWLKIEFLKVSVFVIFRMHINGLLRWTLMSCLNILNITSILLLSIVLSACVSRGSAVRKLDDDRFEVRAWDGYGCPKTADNKTCFTLLMPIIKGKAEERCEGAVKSITPCLRYEATTGDRIFCRVECDVEDEEESES